MAHDKFDVTIDMPFGDQARRRVFNYVNERLNKADSHITFALDQVYVVWSCFTLSNWKVLVSTTLPDLMYYEVTYNMERCETYLDAYRKFDNLVIPDGA